MIWAAGKRYYDTLREATPEHPRLRLVPYLDRMDLAYAAADLALCRSGAITCSELAVTGTPSVLVPSPNVTADHQTKNAPRPRRRRRRHRPPPRPTLAARFTDAVLSAPPRPARRSPTWAGAAREIARPDAGREIAEAVVAIAEARPAR